MGTHAAALGITLYAYYFARTDPNIKNNPEKTEQVNALGGFASAIVLFIVALYIGWEALMRLSSPEPIGYEEAILVAIIGLIVNLYCAHILGDGHHHTHTHHEHHTNEFDSGKWGIIGEYLEDFNQPYMNESTDFIIQSCLKNKDEKIYICAIGCLTNIASALLIEPKIIKNLVVVWTSGFPSYSPLNNKPSLNLVQDVKASQLVFSCGVSVVYLPGFNVGEQLTISLPLSLIHI